MGNHLELALLEGQFGGKRDFLVERLFGLVLAPVAVDLQLPSSSTGYMRLLVSEDYIRRI
jgi:hypothetical protein